jgi:hypothetical protein
MILCCPHLLQRTMALRPRPSALPITRQVPNLSLRFPSAALVPALVPVRLYSPRHCFLPERPQTGLNRSQQILPCSQPLFARWSQKGSPKQFVSSIPTRAQAAPFFDYSKAGGFRCLAL